MTESAVLKHLQQEQIGYKQTLNRRHVQMIAIGGAIGSGLFLGSAKLMHATGPALVISYALAGIFALALMLVVGELVLHRPTSGAFVSYTREFFGERWAFCVGWMYWFQWAITGVADLTAVGSYLKGAFHGATWPGALIGFVIVLSLNLVSARAFGEFEFWASLLKVLAIVIFLIGAIVLVVFGMKVGNQHAGLHNLNSGDGFWPHGNGHNWFYPILVLNGVLFAYVAIELVAVAAGEMENSEQEVPRAVKSVIARIAVFYIGSIFLLVCLLPTSEYIGGTSPFVTVTQKLNSPLLSSIIPPVLTAILIVAALSSLNSGLYSTGRILRSLGLQKQAPGFVTKLNTRGVPVAGISFTAIIFLIGILLNYLLNNHGHNPLFDIAQEIASLAIIGVWISVFCCQLRLRYLNNRGIIMPSKFRAPLFPVLSIFGIVFLICVVIFCIWGGTPTGITFGTHHNFSSSQIALLFFPCAAILLTLGWQKVKANVKEVTGGNLGSSWPSTEKTS